MITNKSVTHSPSISNITEDNSVEKTFTATNTNANEAIKITFALAAILALLAFTFKKVLNFLHKTNNNEEAVEHEIAVVTNRIEEVNVASLERRPAAKVISPSTTLTNISFQQQLSNSNRSTVINI